MLSRIEKPIARRLTIMLAPECGEVLSHFRAKRDGWVKLPHKFEELRKNSGLGDSYVVAYEDESRILSSLFKGIFSENASEELKQFNTEFLALTPEERIEVVDAVSKFLQGAEFKLILDNAFVITEKDRETARQAFEAQSSEKKAADIQSIQYLLIFFYSIFYNSLSLMVHGQKLTTLVPLALQGDKESFCKAVQIDRNLLTGHPYFRDTYARLQSGDDKDFLDAVLYRIGNPTTRGKIRFPSLYMVFATLEGFHWLDEFTASEILDICDEARLDRFQNRIEDENYLTKRRIEYRRMQRIGLLSMH